MPTLTGWEAVVLAMKAEGVPYVFGLPGDPRHLYDALVAFEPDGEPRPIGVRFETSGAFMAMAYAQVTNQNAALQGRTCPQDLSAVRGIGAVLHGAGSARFCPAFFPHSRCRTSTTGVGLPPVSRRSCSFSLVERQAYACLIPS